MVERLFDSTVKSIGDQGKRRWWNLGECSIGHARVLIFLTICLLWIFVIGIFTGCSGKKETMEPVIPSPTLDIRGTWDGAPEEEDMPTGDRMPINNIEDIKKGLRNKNLDIERAWEILNPLLKKNPDNIELLCIKSNLLWTENKFDRALKILDDILEKDSTNTTALIFKTQLLLDRFKNESARETVEKLMKIDPNRRAHKLMKAKVLLRLQKYDDAEKILLGVIRENPDQIDGYNIDAYLSLIDVYDAGLESEKGLKLINKALQMPWPDPGDKSRLVTRLGVFLERQGNEREAVKCFQEAINIDPDNYDARAKLSMSGVNPFDPVRMKSEADKALDITDDEPEPLLAQALFNINEHRFTLAKVALYQAIEKFPLEVGGYNLLGYYTLNLKDYRESQMAYLRAKTRFPGDYDALMGEALLAMVRRDFESAKKIISSLHIPEQRKGEHYRRLGDIYLFHLRDYDNARENYKIALKYMDECADLKDGPVMAMVNLGYIALRNNKDDLADKYFRRALATMPEDINIITKIIYVLIQNKRYETAKKYISKWEKLNSQWSLQDRDTEEEREYLEEWDREDEQSGGRYRSMFYLRFANAFMINGDLDEAEKMIEMSKKANPEDPMKYNRLGRLALIRGEKEKARSYFKKMVKLYPDESYSWFYLGLLAEEKGDREKAKRYYNESTKFFRSPGDLDYHRAWIYSLMRKKEPSLRALREACDIDIFNACKAYSDDVFDWMRDDKFFKEELPELITQVKDKTHPPPAEELVW
ncbi:MAG: tetratricopeptide repeat protein [Candidatus Eremiobacteraeota bacterium]|nr:tetratricopeptide repeat protein [Candidatus Eremiobacteraeota bacterium]